MDKSIKNILDSIAASYRNILKDNLVGIYVHGSLAMNCFNPNISDIDLLVVIKENLDFNEKRQLIDALLKLDKQGPRKGFEMSILLEEHAKNFKYPTPFVLHFSKEHKEKYERDYSYMCENGEDHDLAAHITITTARGICIFGRPIKDVFQAVPKKYYLKSIMCDIENAREDILNSPVYTILNLCRVLYYLREGMICSKKEGGEWAYSSIPIKYTEIIEQALLCYKNTKIFNYDTEALIDFADFMMKEIKRSI
ncbi:aminoglycoside adenylyltransferase domain-containing protein [Desnuesiella massiliensis]|uniref:aminoglycoside adenylyltransferase domain-containing protein n=1 Tax=Desnuesiella massiliensis TaxID=1650662 RepID=UPI0006E19388|nr:aminoglycoside adenylyltransferase domain-containing protein [Desnuesiella massiliensis]